MKIFRKILPIIIFSLLLLLSVGSRSLAQGIMPTNEYKTTDYQSVIVFVEQYPDATNDKFGIAKMLEEGFKERGFRVIAKDKISSLNLNELCSILYVFPHHLWNIGNADELSVEIKNCQEKIIDKFEVDALSFSHQLEAKRLVINYFKRHSKPFPKTFIAELVTETNNEANKKANSANYKASVTTTCGNCGGTGKVRCSICYGNGKISCSSCYGSGTIQERVRRSVQRYNASRNQYYTDYEYVYQPVRCSSCSGNGKISCRYCDGSGHIGVCTKCQGKGVY